ncbi:Exosome complex component CSL4 [Holothuria leucospilota]|uniref:Exosome complex component CSL4 n=1 Tax=Holothuria leucospilota TaxID=206669 RepID=A0A9Q0YP43_HOLLE|nr:Exosome complex component CSL4 [Holothuria leucospilota]
MYVGVFYRSQATNVDYINNLDSALKKIPPHASIWLLRGFNLPDITWENFKFTAGGSYAGPSKAMIDIALDHNLHQQKANFESIKNIIDDLDVKFSTHYVRDKSINELATEFNHVILKAMDQFIPSKLSSSRWKLPWITSTIKKSICKKKRLYRKAKYRNSSEAWNAFRKLRHHTDRTIRIAKRNYIHDIIGESLQSNNTKPFWNFIKSKRQEVFGVHSLKTPDGSKVCSAKDKANALNNQFCAVFTKEDMKNFPDMPESVFPEMPKICIDQKGVENLLLNLNPNKAAGPDAIPAKILRECASSLAPVLTKIFQKSLDSGCLPEAWLDAKLPHCIKRAIDVSLVIIDLYLSLQFLVRSWNILFIITLWDKILVDVQHGFRKGRSCDTQLSALIDDLASILDNKGQADLIIMDFSKAFDSVHHRRLLGKLHNLGIRSNTLNWIESFLTNGHQQVVLEGISSNRAKVSSGVPQGTVLGPLLYLAYINDLPSKVHSKIRLFPDDCILYSKINTTEDSKRLQKDLDSLLSWEKDWQMSFNASKCFTLRVTHKKVPITNNYMMGDTVLEEVKHHPYLGVELSNDLKWSTHISQITTKANKMLGLLKRNIYYCSKSTRSIAYKSLVRPKLEYCSTIWDPKHKLDRDKLEKIQNRAARFTVGDYSRDSSITKILADLEWERLHVRRTRSRLITIYKETHGERLGSADLYKAGEGTYIRHGFIFSSLAGYKKTSTVSDGEIPEISVVSGEQSSVIPEVRSIVTAKVLAVNTKYCSCAILGVEGKSLKGTFRGMIRREDIRATEQDKVEVYKSFRPGDIILARVVSFFKRQNPSSVSYCTMLSLGDARSYLLTTAENELGVVLAQSEAGVNLVPISWCEMICPKTHIKELRKVAKVQPDYIQTN